MLDAGAGNADRVDFLECIAADGMTRYLAGDDDDRNRIHVGGGNSGDGIGRARSRGHQADTGFAGRPGVTVGRMRRTLFVAHQNVFQVILLLQGIVNMQYRAARISKDILDTFVLQELDDLFQNRIIPH